MRKRWLSALMLVFAVFFIPATSTAQDLDPNDPNAFAITDAQTGLTTFSDGHTSYINWWDIIAGSCTFSGAAVRFDVFSGSGAAWQYFATACSVYGIYRVLDAFSGYLWYQMQYAYQILGGPLAPFWFITWEKYPEANPF